MFRTSSASIACFLAASSLLLVSGCSSNGTGGGSGGGSTTSGGLAAGGAASVYIVDDSGTVGVVQRYVAGANGATTPSATIALPSGFEDNDLKVDTSSGIYVAGTTSGGLGEVIYYPSGATAPSQTLNLANPYAALGLDNSNNIYVIDASGTGTVSVYPTTATGSATPTRTFTSSLLASLDIYAATADGSGNVYVAGVTSTSANEVLVFAAGATGTPSPTRTLTLTAVPYGVTVDTAGDIFVSENTGTAAAFIAEYTGTASSPAKTITLTGNTASLIGGISVDGVGNLYGLLDTDVNSTDSFSIVALAPSLTGSVAPTRQMTSTSIVDPDVEVAAR